MKKEKLKITVGTELIFTDGKTQMDIIQVESIDKKSGLVVLSNRVKVARTLDVNGVYPRLDNKGDQYCLPMTEENIKKFEVYKARNNVKRILSSLGNLTKDMINWDNDKVLLMNKKLSKLLANLGEE